MFKNKVIFRWMDGRIWNTVASSLSLIEIQLDRKALEYNDLSAQDTEWTNLIVAGGVRIPTAFDEIFLGQ